MEPYGKGLQRVLVVGESPGRNEDEEGRPFIGKAGAFLRDALDDIGIDLDDDAVTTNALICRPEGNKIKNRKCVDYCRPNVLKTIARVKPLVIVTLGRHALASVIETYWKSKTGTLDRWIGWKIPLAKHWVCPTWHPSYLMRQENDFMNRQFREHLRAAFTIRRDPPQVPDLASKIERIYEEEEIVRSIKWFETPGKRTAFDFETNCVKPELPKARIWSASISNGHRTIAFPWLPGRVQETFDRFLLNADVPKVSSNMKFEDRWTRVKLGHPVANWDWDTMLAAHCLDNRPGITSLKFQSFVNMGVFYNERIEPWLKSHRGPYNRIQEIPLDDLLLYNGIDSYLEVHLAKFQQRRMGYEN
jgi:DNA polymerase